VKNSTSLGVPGAYLYRHGGMAAGLFEFAPIPLLYALAGFCLFGVVMESLQESFRGPLRYGPMVALGVSLSKITLFDLGPLFWSLVFGIGISLVLEKDKMYSIDNTKSTKLKMEK
jgi:predicted benzoate:H+ symporter BenE